ncbi:MAG TPA: hypothetical protein VIK78_05230 [Ruminiclostridium sp.]
MKNPYLSRNEHIAISTNYIQRAINYLESQGCEFDNNTDPKDAKGNLTTIYFKSDFGGFAVQLLQIK